MTSTQPSPPREIRGVSWGDLDTRWTTYDGTEIVHRHDERRVSCTQPGSWPRIWSTDDDVIGDALTRLRIGDDVDAIIADVDLACWIAASREPSRAPVFDG